MPDQCQNHNRTDCHVAACRSRKPSEDSAIQTAAAVTAAVVAAVAASTFSSSSSCDTSSSSTDCGGSF